MAKFTMRSHLLCTARELYDWHARPQAFSELQPPWEQVDLLSEPAELHVGQMVHLQIRVGFLRIPWTSCITAVQDGRAFTDEQRRGPFALWVHEHRFIDDADGSCWLEDRISYRLPLEPLSGWLVGWLVRRRLQRMFLHRHAVMAAAFGTVPEK